MRAYVALASAAISACSFVVGTSTYVLGADAGDDATTFEAGGDDASPDAPYDVGSDAPCFTAGCFVEAGVCGTSCGVTGANCVAGCSTKPCKDNCAIVETACRNACAASCTSCTLSAGCEDKPGCADAAAM